MRRIFGRVSGSGNVDEQQQAFSTRRVRVGLATAVLMSSMAFISTAQAHERGPIVRTQDGALRGIREDGVDRFLGIPFAAPPVGGLRWKPPVAPERWPGVRDASTPPPLCTQLGGAGSEDCLYLNVYRPSKPRRPGRLPVLFFIHGGGLKVGGNDSDPSRIAETTDTVVVMIAYRLGQFGFLAHPALGAEAGDGTSGEYGLMDQQAALRWARDNARAFGGDPLNITISGMSAGGWSVCAHMASPSMAGSFSGAVIISGGCYSRPLDVAQTRGVEFATALGCPDTDSTACLRSKSTAEILAADSWAFDSAIVSGGRLVPEDAAAALFGGRLLSVPVMIGNTPNELLQALGAQFPMTEETYVRFVHDTFGAAAAGVLELYPVSAYGDPLYAYAEVVDDSGIAGGGSCIFRDQKLAFAAQTQTYVYEFADRTAPVPLWVSIPEGFELGSSHGSDEIYWYDRPTDATDPLSPPQRRLARQMIEYLGAFVERQSPQVWGQPRWPRFEATRERVLQFQPGAVVVRTDIDDQNHCEFWKSVTAH